MLASAQDADAAQRANLAGVHSLQGLLSCVTYHAGVARNLKMQTGFNASEIFRKYLWYLLRERKFDSEAVNDVVQLKASLQLSDEEVNYLAMFEGSGGALCIHGRIECCCLF